MKKITTILACAVLSASVLITNNIKAAEVDMTPEDFNIILQEEVSPKKLLKVTYIVDSKETFAVAMKDMDDRLPTKVIVKGKGISNSKLKAMFREYRLNFHDMLNYNTLSDYTVADSNVLFQLNDETDRDGKYTAKQYEEALDLYVERLAEEVKGNTNEESVLNLYNWIYANFKYNANSSNEMRISNIAKGELACNGFSRLTHEVLNKLGITNEIKAGESHFWNLVTIGDTTTTFDVTTDIVLKKKYYTLGTDTETHANKTASVGFYSAKYLGQETKEVSKYDFNTGVVSK